MTNLVPFPVVVPLALAAFLAACNKHLPRLVADGIALLGATAALFITLRLVVLTWHQPLVYWFGGWAPRAGMALGISFVVDPVGASLAAFACLLMVAALVFSLHYFDSVGTLYPVLMLGFLAGMCGFCLTGDLFNLFVFFELMSASAFALCGYKNEETSAQQGALNFGITNTMGALLVLIGIAFLYSRTGALNMAQIGRALSNQDDSLVIFSFVLILCGFYVKAAAVPFHFWLADAHAVAPTPVCILFSGIMVELGIYGVARVYWSIFDGPFSAHRHALMFVLLTLGTVTSLVGAIMCFGQRHIKRLLAFSTISHVGLLIIAFALLTPGALTGLLVYIVGHGLAKGALFIVAGILLHRFESVDQQELHGRARDCHWTALVFIAGGFGLAALPPFGTFFGEHLIHHAAEVEGQRWTAIIFFVAGTLTAAAVFRFAGHVFFGLGPRVDPSTGGSRKIKEERETRASDHKIAPAMFVPAAVLVLLALCVGLVPRLAEYAQTAASVMSGRTAYQARVLDAAYIPSPVSAPEHSPMLASILQSLATAAAALGLAGLTLSLKWTQRKKRAYTLPLRSPLYALRAIHTGHIGDYVAFLTFGVAVIGLAMAVLIRFL